MQDLYSSAQNLTGLNTFHASYYDYGNPEAASRTVLDFRRALKLLEARTGCAPGRIFDAGCGNGLFLAVAKRGGWLVRGCDSGKGHVDLAMRKFGIKIECADFAEYVPSPEKFDAVTFWDVLEHLRDPHAFIRKAASMLKPGGLIAIGGPNDKSLLRLTAEFFFRMSLGHALSPLKKVYLLEHVAYYTQRTMKRLFDAHGYDLCDFFATSTDLEKYRLSYGEKIMAQIILTMGQWCGLQNRFVAIFKPRNARAG